MSSALIDVVVAGIDEPAPRVRTLRLVPPDPTPLPPFVPGSHVEVECGGRRNAYSLTSDPRDASHYEISVLRCEDGSGGSRYLHDHLEPGDRLRISQPRSAFAPPASARRHLLIGAGIGITPFLSYARAFARTGAPYEIHHVYRADGAPHAELATLPGDRVVLHRGRATFWDSLPALLASASLGTHLSVCGPPAMIDAVLAAARAAGWPEHRLHSERFVGVEAPPGAPFRARLRSRDAVIDVGSTVPLLDALLDAGIEVPHLCRQGVCGECKVRVLRGRPLHHDLHLSDAERAAGTVVMACVSRAEDAELELDL
jgi:dimethylamine monooxygenase subunit B